MQDTDLTTLRASLGISKTELARRLGVTHTAVYLAEVSKSLPRADTVSRWLSSINAILTDRGSARRVSYDELWSAFCVGRLALSPAPKPDLAAGLSALGDLPAVDQRTAAPSAQEA